MILGILVFVLGFCTAGLLSLACLPALWGRALRLTEERLSRLVPLSPDEIAAERDHLRATHAVALRRVEQRLEGSEADRAALRVAASRRDAHVAELDEAAIRAQVRIASLDAEGAGLRRDLAELWADHGAEALALDGLSRLADRRLEDIAALQADLQGLRDERDGLREQVDRGRGSLAGLETRLIGAETRGGDLERELDEARRGATAAAERLAAAAADREAAASDRTLAERRGAEIEALKAELAFMVEQARSAERRAADSAKACDDLRAERAASEAATPARAEPPRGAADLRAAVVALAEEILRAGPRGETAA